MFNRISLLLLFYMGFSQLVYSEIDPMKSLFLFQEKMAINGQPSSMIKVGEMYERGEGVKQSNAKALEMYQKAALAGHVKAKAAIQRIKSNKNKSNITTLNEKQRRRILAAQKLRKAKLANEKAAKLKAQNAKLAKARLAEIKAQNDKRATERATKIKAQKVQFANDRVAKAKVRKKNLTEKRNAEVKARNAKFAKERAAKIKAQKEKLAQESVAEVVPQKAIPTKEKFNADPCKGKAARLLSTCR